MKLIFVALFLFASSAFAEHDATYCGKFIDGRAGRLSMRDHLPEVVIAVEYSIEKGKPEVWEEGFAGVVGLSDKQLKFVKQAVQNRKKTELFFA